MDLSAIHDFIGDGKNFQDFDRVKEKRSTRPDLHAFNLLDELFPSYSSIIRDSKKDEIWLNISPEMITTISQDHILELNRCGVVFTEDGPLMYL